MTLKPNIRQNIYYKEEKEQDEQDRLRRQDNEQQLWVSRNYL